MCLNTKSDEIHHNYSCYLKRMNDNGPMSVNFLYEIFIVAHDGSKKQKHVSKNKCTFEKNYCGINVPLLSLTDYLKYAGDPLSDGSLTICCRMWKEEMKHSLQVFIGTSATVYKEFHEMKIECLSGFFRLQNYIRVPETSRFAFYLYGNVRENIGLRVAQVNLTKYKELNCKFSVLNADKKVIESSPEYHCHPCLTNIPFSSAIWLHFENLRFHSAYSDSIILTLLIEMTFVADDGDNKYFGSEPSTNKTDIDIPLHQPSLADLSGPELAPDSLGTKLWALYQDSKFCDATLQTETSSIPVHRAVLCAHSPVFSAMFDNDLEEKQTAIVHIPNLSEETVRKMLSFMYTGLLEDLTYESATDLYLASDQYNIGQLNQGCRSFLKSVFGMSNVIDVLVLADMHQDDELKTASQDFMFENDREFIDSERWKEFMGENSKLAAETMQALYCRKLKK